MKARVSNGMKLDNGPSDTINLLDSTDSDVEWLNLPPIKGKKPKNSLFLKLWGTIVGGTLASHARVNVDFKPSKRMKKRRELDALVGVGKSRRKSSNSGHELLRSNGSESSDDDVYQMPPHRPGSGLCSTCTSILVFILLVACLLVCAGLAWMHVEMKKDLESLRSGLSSVEGRNRVNVDDLQKLYQQMALVNKTLESHSSSFSNMQVNITAMNNVISQLSGTMEKLDASIKAAPELKNLPDKLVTVSQSLAHLGSTVDSMQDTVNKVEPYIQTTDTKLEDLSKQIQAIQVPANPTDRPDSGFSPELSNLLQDLTREMENMNNTLVGQVDALMKSSTVYEGRLSKLEETIESLSKNVSKLTPSDNTDHTTTDLGEETFKTKVESIVKNVISESGDSVPGNNSRFENIMQNLTTMAETLTQLEEKYHKQSSEQVDGGDYVTHSMFTELEEGFTMKVQGLNTTVTDLKTDVHTLAGKIVKQANSVSNLTYHVFALQQLITIIQEELQQPVPNLGPQLVTERPSTEKSMVTKAPDTTIQPKAPTTVTQADKPESKETGTVAPTTAKIPVKKEAVITVERIKTLDDFNLEFDRWDRGGTGKVRYDVLEGYLGPDLPDKSVMDKQVDEDHDGLYSQEELAKAFGFDLSFDDNNTTDEPTDSQPPR